MNECPCIDCLVYPMCKSRVDEYLKVNNYTDLLSFKIYARGTRPSR